MQLLWVTQHWAWNMKKIYCPIFLLITRLWSILRLLLCPITSVTESPQSSCTGAGAQQTSRCLILSGTFIHDVEVHCGVNMFNTNSLATSNPTFIPIIWLPILNDNETLIVLPYMFQCCTVSYNLKDPVNTSPLFLILYLLVSHCGVILCSHRKTYLSFLNHAANNWPIIQ